MHADGTRLVYWGIGETPAQARINAEAQEVSAFVGGAALEKARRGGATERG